MAFCIKFNDKCMHSHSIRCFGPIYILLMLSLPFFLCWPLRMTMLLERLIVEAHWHCPYSNASSHNRKMLCLDQFCQSLIVRICFSGEMLFYFFLSSLRLFLFHSGFITYFMHCCMIFCISHHISSLALSCIQYFERMLRNRSPNRLRAYRYSIHVYIIALHAKPETKHETLTFAGETTTTKHESFAWHHIIN